jgi:hypothetical protein
MTLTLILNAEPDTRLSELLHPFDFYDLALGLDDSGIRIEWPALLAMETCGDVQGLLGEVV